MLSPTMTVVVLAVLWLIVVVPMVLKRKDDRAGERSVAKFGGAMHALSVRRALVNIARPVPNFDDELHTQDPGTRLSRPQTFIPGRGMSGTIATRSPQRSGVESIMHPDRVARADFSEGRRQMMARRRRSLTVLIAGTVLGVGWLVAGGGLLPMLAAVGFSLGLFGYLYFLRSQALRDRARRETRVRRVAAGGVRPGMAEVAADEMLTERLDMYVLPETAVRIDDDDVELLGLAETIDLTGSYTQDTFDDLAMRRAV